MTEQEMYDTYILAINTYSEIVPEPTTDDADAWMPYWQDRMKYGLHVVCDQNDVWAHEHATSAAA